MDTHQIVWILISVPIMTIYAILELIRGWKIIVYKEPSLNVALQIQIWIVKIFRNRKSSEAYKEK
ncbi:MAG: hypothetical protein GY755_12100 [Chloroflexi bacterium]|nr:hypothetical protein [Chloroflexota bacterium]